MTHPGTTARTASRILVWQWGRFGGAPRFASLLTEGLRQWPGIEVSLSLARGAEILRETSPPKSDLLVDTYNGLAGFLMRALTAPFAVGGLVRRIKALRPDIAICAQTGPLDLLMAAALKRLNIPFVVVVHDADAHPGDRFPRQIRLQAILCRRAVAVAALTAHVGNRLIEQHLAGTPNRPLIRLRHPPVRYAFAPEPDREPGMVRLLSFGRLLPYKGLDLLVECLKLLGSRPNLTVRVVGSGPEGRELSDLRALPGVTVENRWVPESEVGAVFGWADVVVLPYREASQSGVAAVALAARKYVVATNVGGLAEQLGHEPRAILCEPNALALANGLRRALDNSRCPPPGPLPDAADGWREMARSLLDQIGPFLANNGGGH